MCGLFGLLDYQRKLSPSETAESVDGPVGIESEIRGTDASGIACYQRKKLHIQKAPGPAHQMEWDIGDAAFIMGHTRAATLGSPKDNYNNHPFPGFAGESFALAHNGVLWDNPLLKRKLPKTPVQTDSYLAVQLLEQHERIDISAIRDTAEMLDGTFALTVLSRKGLFFIRGSSPLYICRFPSKGLILYASTQEIMERALQRAGFQSYHQKIDIQPGEIIEINRRGQVQRTTFYFLPPYYYDYSPWQLTPSDHETALIYAKPLGLTVEEVEVLAFQRLHRKGFGRYGHRPGILGRMPRHVLLTKEKRMKMTMILRTLLDAAKG